MKRAVVICPGRGTYNAAELGYLARNFPAPNILARFDRRRQAGGQETLASLDGAARFSAARHGGGANASVLIFAATYGDFLSLDRSEIEVVAVTGNSMGWYSALTCAGALAPDEGFTLVNTMGRLMEDASIGGQIVYPWMDNDWTPCSDRKASLLSLVAEISGRPGHALALSIDLGGMLVLGGNEAGLKAFGASAEPIDKRFPMRLANHAAFHTRLQEPVAIKAQAVLGYLGFQQPDVPLIDGRGHVFWPGATSLSELGAYTLSHQVTEPYDFTRAVRTAVLEFAPDLVIVTGPGTTLGGATAQSLVLARWRGVAGKTDFQAERQALVVMGDPEQRRGVVSLR